MTTNSIQLLIQIFIVEVKLLIAPHSKAIHLHQEMMLQPGDLFDLDLHTR